MDTKSSPHTEIEVRRTPDLAPQSVRNWIMRIGARNRLSARKYIDAINRITALIPPGSEVTVELAGEIYSRLLANYSVATANLSVYAASSYWSYLVETKHTDQNPWKQIKKKNPHSAKHERIMTEEQIRAMLKACDLEYDYIYLRFLYATGCRVTESVSVEWDDIMRDKDGYTMRIHGKGDKDRFVHIPESLFDLLQEIPKSNKDHRIFRISSITAWKMVKAIAKKAGLGDAISPHWFRHSHASHALDRGAPIHVVQHDLGHASITTTQQYLHVRPGFGSADVIDKSMDE